MLAVAFASGVSDGFGELFFFGPADFPGEGDFFFFFPLGELSCAGDFFFFAVASGVSEGFAELSKSSDDAFFFLVVDPGDASLAGDFFFAAASGVSLGSVEASGSSDGVFFFFVVDFGVGVGDFFVLCGEVLDFGVGEGDSSDSVTACALRIGLSSSVCCA